VPDVILGLDRNVRAYEQLAEVVPISLASGGDLRGRSPDVRNAALVLSPLLVSLSGSLKQHRADLLRPGLWDKREKKNNAEEAS